jgi:WD40 repeat protein
MPSPSPTSASEQVRFELIAEWEIPAEGLAWSPDSKYLAVFTWGYIAPGVQVYDIETHKESFEAQTWVADGIFTPDGTRVVVSGFGTNRLEWFDAETGELTGQEEGNIFDQIAALPDGETLVVGHSFHSVRRNALDALDTSLFLYDFAAANPIAGLQELPGLVVDLLVSPDGSRVAAVLHGTDPGVEDHVVVFDPREEKQICDLPGHAAAFNPGQNQFAIAQEGSVMLHDASSCELIGQAGWEPTAEPGEPVALDFILEGEVLLATGWGSGQSQAWDLPEGKTIHVSGLPVDPSTIVGDPIVESPDGLLLATIDAADASRNNQVRVWKITRR